MKSYVEPSSRLLKPDRTNEQMDERTNEQTNEK